MKPFKAIAAMGENRVIGHKGKLPWHLPDEFMWFKDMTMGHTLLMGRKTYGDVGKPLPGRKTIVLSRQGGTFEGAETLTDWRKLDPKRIQGDLFVAGGAEIFAQMLPYCSDLYLTVVQQKPEGDTFFPPFEDGFELMGTLREGHGWRALHYHNLQLRKW